MSVNKKDSGNTWVDPDDAPEIDDDFFQAADLYDGEKLVRKGRGPQKAPTKEQVTLRLSRDVLEYLRSTGPGWQTRLSDDLEQLYKDKRPL